MGKIKPIIIYDNRRGQEISNQAYDNDIIEGYKNDKARARINRAHLEALIPVRVGVGFIGTLIFLSVLLIFMTYFNAYFDGLDEFLVANYQQYYNYINNSVIIFTTGIVEIFTPLMQIGNYFRSLNIVSIVSTIISFFSSIPHQINDIVEWVKSIIKAINGLRFW